MSDFPLSLDEVEDQAMVETIVQIFIEKFIDGSNVKKDSMYKFFDSLLHNLQNKGISPKTKFYSVFILKQLSVKEKISAKIFGPFAQTRLYQYIEDLAFNIDPKKNLSEKGKNLFPTDKTTGNQLMRLILESFIAWSSKFPTNSKKQATRFAKTYNSLVEEKVVLPKDFIYYKVNAKKPQQKQTPKNGSLKADAKIKQLPSQKALSNPMPPKPKESKQKYMVELKYIQNKIEQLLGIIEDGQQQQMRREVKSFHNKFQKDRQKLREYEGFIFQLQSQEIVNKYLNVNAFLQQQEIIYNKFVLKDDYASYVSSYLISFEKQFQRSQLKNKKTPQPSKNQISIDKNINDKSKVNAPPYYKSEEQKVPTQQLKLESRPSIINKKQNPSQNPYNYDNAKAYQTNNNSNKDKQNKNITESFFAKLSKAPKVPHEGFHSIARSLQKSKLNVIAPRMKSSNSNNSHLQRTKLLNGSSMNKSGFTLKGIFANPPNPNVRIKNYEGQLVIQNLQLQKQCQIINKKQGLRRFKASLFKTKTILYEDQFIQVGFKSSAIYEKVQKFTSFLDLQIFYGNKTNHNITKFQIYFEGDKRSLIYTNPQKIQHKISPQQQVKMELLSVTKIIPYNFVSMAASYQILGDSFSFVSLLPTSILQMTSYYDIDIKQIDSKWLSCSHILKTQPFKLSRHFPPNQFTHFLPKLKQKTPYIIFIEPGSITDYQLFCQMVIQESFESILKIIVRPDLNVILQIGAYQNNQNTIRYFKFYLQSLMVALKQFYV